MHGTKGVVSLHRLERRVLDALAHHGKVSLQELVRLSGLNPDQARRAIEWLRSRGLVEATSTKAVYLMLGEKGRESTQKGLPERVLYELVKRIGPCTLDAITEHWPHSKGDLNPAIGKARERGWISIQRTGRQLILSASEEAPTTPEEELLKKLKEELVQPEALTADERTALQTLKRRPDFIEERTEKQIELSITKGGRQALALQGPGPWIDSLTPELIVSGRWKKYRLRPIDVTVPGPVLHPARIHPLNEIAEEVREVFLSMGFEEIEGTYVQSCFWNFDALFVPQDHPGREMQDTFYIKDVTAKVLTRNKWVSRVRDVHLNGWETGSKGWRGGWSLEEARRLVLRTHTTAVTIRYLAEERPKEARVFSVDRVFRNEKVTYKSNIEFNQIEGIVVGPGLNLRNLIGLLSEFYRRLGLREVKFWPSYFPYTEPSLQAMVKFGDRWLEMGGSGMFRPEVTLPFGVKNPVLAWGLGLDRLAMLKVGLEDIRTFYEADLGWLRGGS